MNILRWNCRGSGGRATLPTLKQYLLSTRAHLAFVSETKCEYNIAIKRIASLQLPNFEIIQSFGKSGGLWLLWCDDIRVTMLEKSFYYMFVKIENVLGSWLLGLIYGDLHHVVMSYIYEHILYYSGLALPLCLIGDFNSILTTMDKFGGSSRQPVHMREFKNMVQQIGLLDLGYRGPAFTWSNNQQNNHLIMQRLDRAMASVAWMAQFPTSVIYHLSCFNSDHHQILLRTSPPPV